MTETLHDVTEALALRLLEDIEAIAEDNGASEHFKMHREDHLAGCREEAAEFVNRVLRARSSC